MSDAAGEMPVRPRRLCGWRAALWLFGGSAGDADLMGPTGGPGERGSIRLSSGLRKEAIVWPRRIEVLGGASAAEGRPGTRGAEGAAIAMTRRGVPFWSPEPVLGFRMWRLTADGMHGAVQVWSEPRLEAWCLLGPGAPHDYPACRCGIYAFKEAKALWASLHPGWGVAVCGVVALTGRVAEHKQGYRAQRAEVLAVTVLMPGAVVVSSNPEWLARLFTPTAGAAAAREARGMPLTGLSRRLGVVGYLADEARRFRDHGHR